MAELYDKDVRTINEHLINIYKEGELVQNVTIRKFRIVRLEGSPSIPRNRSLQSRRYSSGGLGFQFFY